MNTFQINKKHKIIFVMILLSTLIVPFQNCSAVRDVNKSSESVSSSSEADFADNEAKVFGILEAKCSSCHNADNANISSSSRLEYILDKNSLLFYKMIRPGEPDLSDLFSAIKKGEMPPSKPLSTDDIAIINNWIIALKDKPSSVTPPGVITVIGPTYAALNALIFQQRCTVCHSGAAPSGGVNLSTYDGVRAQVNPTTPTNNKLYNSLTRATNFMPRGGARLSTEELAAVVTWIQTGALKN